MEEIVRPKKTNDTVIEVLLGSASESERIEIWDLSFGRFLVSL